MITPPINKILAFMCLNIALIALFNLLLGNITTFLTHESFEGFFVINLCKISMLASVFILTVFTVNILTFKFVFTENFRRSFWSAVRISTITFSVGISFAVIIMVSNFFLCRL